MQVIGNRRRPALIAAGALLIAINGAAPTAAGSPRPTADEPALHARETRVATVAAHAQPSSSFPRLRLIAAETEIAKTRPEGSPAVLNLHTWVAVSGSNLEIHVAGVDTGEPALTQVVRGADGQIVRHRPLPSTLISDVTQGLADFFEVTVSQGGEDIATTTSSFCPAGWDLSRVDDTGEALSEYPQGCWTHELTQGMVWGIQRAWAVRAPGFGDVHFELADGTYEVEVKIADTYRRLFRVHDDQASVMMTLTVTTGEEVEGESLPGPVLPVLDPHLADPSGATPAQVSESASGLPDLIALPAWNLSTTIPEWIEPPTPDVLIFSANVWNGGDGPLVVEGFRQPGEPLMDAYQYFYEDGVNVGRSLVGTLEYDPQPGHRHWHFTDFAEYRLLDTDGEEVARSGKEAFCLANTHAIDMTLTNANWSPDGRDLGTSCGFFGALWIREILDVGWGDTYVQGLPGQWIEIDDVPNGQYVLEVATNQEGRLEELRSDNNAAHVSLLLGGEPGARTVEVLPSP